MSERMLIVEDDPSLRAQLGRAFRGRGFAVDEAGSLAELAALPGAEWSAAVVDLRLPDGSGLEAVRRLRDASADLAIVVLTGYGSIATALEAVRLGAVDYLTKPVDVDQILAALAGSKSAQPAPPSAAPSLERVEWEHIQRVLQDCGGNVSRAAKALGIHRRTLQRKLSYRPPGR